MKFSHKARLVFLVAVLSTLISAWISRGSFDPKDAISCLPTIVFIFPLFALALLVRSWSHRKTATCIFMTGMLIYLSYAVYTLGLELMGPIIGNVYIPVILVTLIFGIYALNDKSKA